MDFDNDKVMNINTNIINKNNEKIDGIKQQFFAALDDFKQYYVYYNKNPEVDEYNHFYSNSVNNLQLYNKDLFLISNEIGKDIEKLNEDIISLTDKLDDEKATNTSFSELLSNIENTQNGSLILINDSKTLYNIRYVKNTELFIGIILISVALNKLFNT